MEKQVENCKKLVSFLEGHPLVKDLYYPGLPSDPGFEINKKQAKTGGSLFSFTTGSVEASRTIASETSLFKITVSFGSVVSLISMPCFMSHASIPAELRQSRGLTDDLLRISAGKHFVNSLTKMRCLGIEDGDDLVNDLDQAMQKAMAVLESRKTEEVSN